MTRLYLAQNGYVVRNGWRGVDPNADPNDIRKWTELRTPTPSASTCGPSTTSSILPQPRRHHRLSIIVDVFNALDLSVPTAFEDQQLHGHLRHRLEPPDAAPRPARRPLPVLNKRACPGRSRRTPQGRADRVLCPTPRTGRARKARLELDDGADRRTGVHQVEGFVDALKRELVRDHRVDLDLLSMYQSTSRGTSVRPRAPPKAVPFQTRPVTSWKGRVAISGRRQRRR